MRASLFVICVAAAGGCMRQEDDFFALGPIDLGVVTHEPDLAGVDTDGGLPTTTLGSGRARPTVGAALHVGAGRSVSLPSGTVAFTVTASGVGGYRVAWVDTAGAGLRYHGSVFVEGVDGAFSQITSQGMNYAVANGGRLDFESLPGAQTLGTVDFVTSVDPIIVDVLAGAADGTLYYPDGNGRTQKAQNPSAFTSP